MKKILNYLPDWTPVVILVSLLGIIGIASCTSLSTSTFRLEQTAMDFATVARAGWSAYYISATNGASPEQLANPQKQGTNVLIARQKFAATLFTLETLRASYASNSSLRPQVESGLLAVNDSLSNIVWLVALFRGQTNAP